MMPLIHPAEGAAIAKEIAYQRAEALGPLGVERSFASFLMFLWVIYIYIIYILEPYGFYYIPNHLAIGTSLC